MNKTGSNPFLKIYIIICAICFLITAIVFSTFPGWEYDSKILEIITILWMICPYSFISPLSLYITVRNLGIWSVAISALILLILWAVSLISVLLGAKSPKPWHIPAVVLLSIDIIPKFRMLVIIGFQDWQFSIFVISMLLLDGLLFFLIWKIRKYATADEPEQIPQKYIDTDFREI